MLRKLKKYLEENWVEIGAGFNALIEGSYFPYVK